MSSHFDDSNEPRNALTAYADWEFGGNASYQGYCEFAYRYQTQYLRLNEDGSPSFDDKSAILDYLVSVGEDPLNYSL